MISTNIVKTYAVVLSKLLRSSKILRSMLVYICAIMCCVCTACVIIEQQFNAISQQSVVVILVTTIIMIFLIFLSLSVSKKSVD